MTLKSIYISTVEVTMIFNIIESLQIFIFKTFLKYDYIKEEKKELMKSIYNCPIKLNKKVIQYILNKNIIAIMLVSLISIVFMFLPIVNIIYTFQIIKSMQNRYSKVRK